MYTNGRLNLIQLKVIARLTKDKLCKNYEKQIDITERLFNYNEKIFLPA